MRAILVTALIAAGTALDLTTKSLARTMLEPYAHQVDFLPFLSLRLTFNSGVSFSMLALEGRLGFFILIGLTGILTLIVTVLAYFSKGRQSMGLSIISAGALGNLIDRSTRSVVTDFLDLHFGEWHLFVFNLADIWISIGVAIMLATQFLPSDFLDKHSDSPISKYKE